MILKSALCHDCEISLLQWFWNEFHTIVLKSVLCYGSKLVSDHPASSSADSHACTYTLDDPVQFMGFFALIHYHGIESLI